jgi:hypothetical protein
MKSGTFVPANFTIGEKASVRFEGGKMVRPDIIVNVFRNEAEQRKVWSKIQGFEVKHNR